jgi:hypothetical protein
MRAVLLGERGDAASRTREPVAVASRTRSLSRSPASVLALQRAAGNSAVARLLASDARRLSRACCSSCASGHTCEGEEEDEREAVTARNPVDDSDSDAAEHEIVTVDPDAGVPDGGPGDAGTTDAGTTDAGSSTASGTTATGTADAGTGTPAAPTATPTCRVTTPPQYNLRGVVPVTTSGGRKSAPFNFFARFATDAATGAAPSCCEVHQLIKWDTAFHTWNGGPPHAGFPATTPAGSWLEDRDAANKRYGHRSDRFSDPIGSCGDEYKTGAARDQANGDHYCGKDRPGGPAAMTGQFQFQLVAVDKCNASKGKRWSDILTVNW